MSASVERVISILIWLAVLGFLGAIVAGAIH
jgi:hypothetical protein